MPAAAAARGLPRTYDVTPIVSASPINGSSFGWGTTSADVTGDGKMDLFVAQSQGGIPGQVFAYDGATNRHLDTIDAPESNENGSSPTLAFVYVEHMADIGSCGVLDGPDADMICDATTVGGLDGRPEIIVGSRALRVGPNGETGCTTVGGVACPTIGRGYVFDGKSLGDGVPGVSVLKRLDMPPDHRESQRLRGASPQFGRAMMSPQGLPPCDGNAGEANNAGVGPCPSGDLLQPGSVPASVRIGDIDGLANSPATAAEARGDIIMGVRGYRETSDPGRVNTASPGSQCATTAPAFNATGSNCTSGKGFIYRGEEIAGSSPREVLDGVTNGQNTGVNTPETPIRTITNVFAQSGSSDVFGNLQRVGDVGSCTAPTAAQITAGASPHRCFSRDFTPDGKPEIIVIDAFADYPLTNPDTTTQASIGAVYVYDGATGLFRDVYEHPERTPRSIFSHNFNSGWAVGNLGHSTLADVMTGAPAQSVEEVGDGRAYVWNGEATASRGRLIGVLDDPTPKPAGNFGSSYTGVGDVADSPQTPTNEVMIGSYAPFITSTEAAAELISDAHIINPVTNRVLQSIPDPAQEKGSGFGMGITPMGDLNDDGFLDFAITSYLSNAVGPSAGRAFIFRSNNKPLTPPPSAPAATVSTPNVLRPGSCTNDTLGTARDDRLKGTAAGDRMLGFGGDDRIEGLEENDCLDGGTGADRLLGGPGRNRLLGGSGADRLLGGAERDRMFGQSGNDRLRGGLGPDVIAGGSGNDRLDGGKHTDRMYGEGGNDRLRAGSGRNFLDGGTGSDRIYARNDRRDVISCGSGRDRVQADRTDVVRVDCERISRAKRRATR